MALENKSGGGEQGCFFKTKSSQEGEAGGLKVGSKQTNLREMMKTCEERGGKEMGGGAAAEPALGRIRRGTAKGWLERDPCPLLLGHQLAPPENNWEPHEEVEHEHISWPERNSVLCAQEHVSG